MKNLILKWLGLDHIPDVSKKVTALENANKNRKQETSEIIETLQNLDNNEVIIIYIIGLRN